MSKELKALKELEQDIEGRVILAEDKQLKLCAVIKQALQRLESIDNANPSEALECLEEIRDFQFGQDKLLVCQTQMYDTIKQALLKAQEQEKVLEIIKEKKINIEQFYLNFIKSGFGYHYYLEKWYKFQSTDSKMLTEEEYDLLKRWLG